MRIVRPAVGLAAVAAVLGLGVGPGAVAAEFKQAKGSTLRARVTDMEFTDGVHYAETYLAGGILTGTYLGKRRTGRWRVAGDELCLKRESDTHERCFEVWLDGSAAELRRSGLDDKEEGTLRPPKGHVRAPPIDGVAGRITTLREHHHAKSI